eukprot:308286-Pyramimonas_sp.AAC.1
MPVSAVLQSKHLAGPSSDKNIKRDFSSLGDLPQSLHAYVPRKELYEDPGGNLVASLPRDLAAGGSRWALVSSGIV